MNYTDKSPLKDRSTKMCVCTKQLRIQSKKEFKVKKCRTKDFSFPIIITKATFLALNLEISTAQFLCANQCRHTHVYTYPHADTIIDILLKCDVINYCFMCTFTSFLAQDTINRN